MGKCVICNKHGLFLKTNRFKVCKNCNPIVQYEIMSILRVIIDSLKIVIKTKNIDTQKTRIELIIEDCKKILPYETNGLDISQLTNGVSISEIYTSSKKDLKYIENNFNKYREKILALITHSENGLTKKEIIDNIPDDNMKYTEFLLKEFIENGSLVLKKNGKKSLYVIGNCVHLINVTI